MYIYSEGGTYTTMYDDPTPPPEVPRFTTMTRIKIDNVRLNDVHAQLERHIHNDVR
jgi:hypothetical protein